MSSILNLKKVTELQETRFALLWAPLLLSNLHVQAQLQRSFGGQLELHDYGARQAK